MMIRITKANRANSIFKLCLAEYIMRLCITLIIIHLWFALANCVFCCEVIITPKGCRWRDILTQYHSWFLMSAFVNAYTSQIKQHIKISPNSWDIFMLVATPLQADVVLKCFRYKILNKKTSYKSWCSWCAAHDFWIQLGIAVALVNYWITF